MGTQTNLSAMFFWSKMLISTFFEDHGQKRGIIVTFQTQKWWLMQNCSYLCAENPCRCNTLSQCILIHVSFQLQTQLENSNSNISFKLQPKISTRKQNFKLQRQTLSEDMVFQTFTLKCKLKPILQTQSSTFKNQMKHI